MSDPTISAELLAELQTLRGPREDRGDFALAAALDLAIDFWIGAGAGAVADSLARLRRKMGEDRGL